MFPIVKYVLSNPHIALLDIYSTEICNYTHTRIYMQIHTHIDT